MEYLILMLAVSFIAWLPLIVIAKIIANGIANRRQPAPPAPSPPRRPLLINGKPIPQRSGFGRIVFALLVLFAVAYMVGQSH